MAGVWRVAGSPFVRARLPVMMAPMAGVSDPRLVVAGARAGLVAMHGAGMQSPEQLSTDLDAIREQAAGLEYGVNLFVYDSPDPKLPATLERLRLASAKLSPILEAKIGKPAATPDAASANPLEEQLQLLLDKPPPFVSFCFGRLSPRWVARLQAAGICVMGTATSVREALALQEDGVDAVVAQGAEAGGHRGSWMPDSGLVGTMALVPQVVQHVHVPVVAAGGIMTGQGVAAALCLGAHGAAMGTAFLTSEESAAWHGHKARVLAAAETDTVVTDAFSGRAARSIENALAQSVDGDAGMSQRLARKRPHVAPYPLQMQMLKPLAAHCREHGDTEHLSLWSGQGTRLATNESVANIVAKLQSELQATLPGAVP